MSSKTEESNHNDIVSLKEYIEKLMDAAESTSNLKIDAVEAKNELKINAVREAITLSQSTLNERLEKMNEFRESLNDQAKTFLTKNEHELYFQRTEEKYNKTCEDINDLKKSRDENAGKATQTQVIITLIIGVVGVLFGGISILLWLLFH